MSICGQVDIAEWNRSCRKEIEDLLLDVNGGVGNSRKNLVGAGVSCRFMGEY